MRQISRRIHGWPLLAPLYREIINGTAPHDRFAPYLFEDFLKRITTEDPEWSALPTWLICTGDITTFGDGASLLEGKRWLERFAQHVKATLWLYGNHDAWPGTLPLFASHDIASHQAQLAVYCKSWPTNPLREPFYDSTGNLVGEVQLYGLDSILHSAWQNTWARGEIEQELLKNFATDIDKNASGAHDLRILATHHPIHYPASPIYQMVMRNATHVARKLEEGSPEGLKPIVHLVLSGHTHALFPKLQELPPNSRECEHNDLGYDQCQFIVGTLMQLDKFQQRGDWPHQCEILRIYRSISVRDIIRLERRLAGRITGGIHGRGQGIGDYRFATALLSGPFGEVVEKEVVEHIDLGL
jgi:hypothetical protein